MLALLGMRGGQAMLALLGGMWVGDKPVGRVPTYDRFERGGGQGIRREDCGKQAVRDGVLKYDLLRGGGC